MVGRYLLVIVASIACLCGGLRAVAAASVPLEAASASGMPFSPIFTFLLDEVGDMTVEEVAAPATARVFSPLAGLRAVSDKNGVVWLRFELSSAMSGFLDMGESVPGVPLLYVSPSSGGPQEWREQRAAGHNLFLLPQSEETLTCLVRVEGVPGLWFAPVLRAWQDLPGNWSRLSRAAAMLVLAVVMALCLLRGLSESGQWRIWAALYVSVALAQGVIGVPAYSGAHISFYEAAGIMTPGVALMLLPHVGRHLINARGRSRVLDIQFLLLSLPGALLALMPFLQNFTWMTRYLELWPVGMLLFVPSALGACIMGFNGAGRFLFGCILPPVFAVAGVLGLQSEYPACLSASLPLWGVALSAMLIAATARSREFAENTIVPEGKAVSALSGTEEALDDPNLRLIAPSLSSDGEQQFVLHSGSADCVSAESLADSLRQPVERLLQEGVALERCALPPAARQYVENMLNAGRNMATIIDEPAGCGKFPQAPSAPFNLQHLMREAHDTVVSIADAETTSAEDSGILAPPEVVDAPAGRPPLPELTTPEKITDMDFIAGLAPIAEPLAASPEPAPRQTADDIQLVQRLDSAMQDAHDGIRIRCASLVGEAARRIAEESDAYGLRVLARMARCVEKAAGANDVAAINDLLPDLVATVERTRIAIAVMSKK